MQAPQPAAAPPQHAQHINACLDHPPAPAWLEPGPPHPHQPGASTIGISAVKPRLTTMALLRKWAWGGMGEKEGGRAGWGSRSATSMAHSQQLCCQLSPRAGHPARACAHIGMAVDKSTVTSPTARGVHTPRRAGTATGRAPKLVGRARRGVVHASMAILCGKGEGRGRSRGRGRGCVCAVVLLCSSVYVVCVVNATPCGCACFCVACGPSSTHRPQAGQLGVTHSRLSHASQTPPSSSSLTGSLLDPGPGLGGAGEKAHGSRSDSHQPPQHRPRSLPTITTWQVLRLSEPRASCWRVLLAFACLRSSRPQAPYAAPSHRSPHPHTAAAHTPCPCQTSCQNTPAAASAARAWPRTACRRHWHSAGLPSPARQPPWPAAA